MEQKKLQKQQINCMLFLQNYNLFLKKWEEANVNKPKMLESIAIYSKENDDIFVFNYLIGSLIKKFKKPKSFN